jgi:hypothetical protein
MLEGLKYPVVPPVSISIGGVADAGLKAVQGAFLLTPALYL